MPLGKNEWRVSCACGSIVVALACSFGCQRPIVQRDDPAPGPAADLNSPLARPPAQPKMLMPVETEVFRSSPSAPATTTPAQPVPAPTPTLDALVTKTEALKKATIESLGGPEPPKKEDSQTPDSKAVAPPSVASKVSKATDARSEIELPSLERSAGTGVPKLIDPDRPAERTKPRDQWRDGLEQLRILAHDRAEGNAQGGGDWALRSRLLDWMAEPAKESESSVLWRSVLDALSATDSAGAWDDRARSEAIRGAVEALEAQSALEISDLRLCRKVNGFGNYETLAAAACKPGRPALVYCELSGLRYETSGEGFRARIAAHVEVLSESGEKVLWSHPLGTAEDYCPRRRRDFYISYRIQLPKSLTPGAFVLRLTQKDLLSDRTTSQTLPLTVEP